jgi:hypothetical protein
MSPNGNVSCSRASEESGMFPPYSDCGVSVVSVSASTQAQTMTFALGSVFPLGEFLEIYSEKRRNSCLFAWEGLTWIVVEISDSGTGKLTQRGLATLETLTWAHRDELQRLSTQLVICSEAAGNERTQLKRSPGDRKRWPCFQSRLA